VVRRVSTRYVRWTVRASVVMRYRISARQPRHAAPDFGVR
jgi:hypothetical protein